MSWEPAWGIYSPVKKAFGWCLPTDNPKNKLKIERFVADRNAIAVRSGKTPHWECRLIEFNPDGCLCRLPQE